MNKLAVILTGFDDSCCRSNAIGNFIIIEKAIKSKYNSIDIYVHPSEKNFLYKLFVKKFKERKHKTICFKNGWKSKKYDMVYTLYSSVIESFCLDQKHLIIDKSLPESFISNQTNGH